MPHWYDHSHISKKIDCRANKQHSDAYFEYEDNPINLKDDEMKNEDEYIKKVVIFPWWFNFTILVMGTYFLAKLIFLIYNDGSIVNIILNGYPL